MSNKATDNEITMIAMRSIKDPTIKMRNAITTNSLASLIESIREHGLINPITVKPEGASFEIIAGHRRYLAMSMLHWDMIPCRIVTTEGLQALAMRYDENAERREISPIEEAEYISQIMEKYDMTQAICAKLLKKSVAYINERVAILDYHPHLVAALANGSITFSVAREFNRIKDEDALLQHLRYAITNGCTPATARMWRKQIEATREYRETAEAEDLEMEPTEPAAFIEPHRMCPVCEEKTLVRDMRMVAMCEACYRAAMMPPEG